MIHPVIRRTVDVAGRVHHIRILGQGPAVVLLHLSPRSSVQVLPLAQMLADRFTVICPDTPGYGQSEPLALARPEIADLADATAALIAALNLDAPTLYGTHTGAEIALELAVRHPALCTRVVVDGLPLFTRQEKEEQLRFYLPRFDTVWSGEHMAALWARVRDQLMFYPWYAHGEANRLRFDPPPIEFHDQVIADLLAAGVADTPNYATGYGAAFRYDAHAAAKIAATQNLDVKYICREDDLLFPHLARVTEVAPQAQTIGLPPDPAPWGAAIGELLDHPGRSPALAPQSSRMFFTGEGMMMRRIGSNDGPAQLLLHSHPGSGQMLMRHAATLAGLVWVPDLPGSGQSAALGDDPVPLAERMAAIVSDVVPGKATVTAWFTGARVADCLPRDRFTIDQIHDPLPVGEDLAALRAAYIQHIDSDWSGAHLMAAWWRARDGLSYDPWFQRDAAHQRPLPEVPDLEMLQAHATAIFLGRKTEPAVLDALLLA
ncbi:alpha/beta fold hydrolase [Pseudooceanicola sp. MF1-13]|uniref:alpha/beta fold hydrolase n=1 Tax=Pseudooceanicola sp. MF1-13 TaxID=3379095 RepID=UPI00389170FC